MFDHLSWIGVNDSLPWEGNTLQLSLNEELAIEKLGSGIERSPRDAGVNIVLSGNGMTANDRSAEK